MSTTENLTHATAPVDVVAPHLDGVLDGDRAVEKKKGTIKSKKEDHGMTTTTTPSTPHAKISDLVFPDYEGRAVPGVLDKNFIESLRADGIINPVTVRQLDNGKYEIVAGRRRVRGAKEIGLKSVPINVVTIKDNAELGLTAQQQAEAMAVAENLERANLNAWDLYMLFDRWVKGGMSQTQVAKVMHRTDGFVSQYLSIGKLPPAVRNIVKQNAPDTAILSKVREIAKLGDYPEIQLEVTRDCFNREDPWSFSQLKEHVDDRLFKETERKKAEAARERQKEQKKRAAADEGDGGEAGEAGDGSDEGGDGVDVDDDPYAEVEISMVGKKIARSMLTYLNTRLTQAKLLPEESDESKLKKMLKIEYEKGRLDGALLASGQKSVPKAVLKAAGVEE